MCEHCEGEFECYYKPNANIFICKNTEQTHNMNYPSKMKIDIKYCPICGRRLGGNEDVN